MHSGVQEAGHQEKWRTSRCRFSGDPGVVPIQASHVDWERRLGRRLRDALSDSDAMASAAVCDAESNSKFGALHIINHLL